MTALLFVLAIALPIGAVWVMLEAESRRRYREREIMRRVALYAWAQEWGTAWGCIGWMASQEFMVYAVMGGMLAQSPDFREVVAQLSGTWARVLWARAALRDGMDQIAKAQERGMPS